MLQEEKELIIAIQEHKTIAQSELEQITGFPRKKVEELLRRLIKEWGIAIRYKPNYKAFGLTPIYTIIPQRKLDMEKTTYWFYQNNTKTPEKKVLIQFLIPTKHKNWWMDEIRYNVDVDLLVESSITIPVDNNPKFLEKRSRVGRTPVEGEEEARFEYSFEPDWEWLSERFLSPPRDLERSFIPIHVRRERFDRLDYEIAHDLWAARGHGPKPVTVKELSEMPGYKYRVAYHTLLSRVERLLEKKMVLKIVEKGATPFFRVDRMESACLFVRHDEEASHKGLLSQIYDLLTFLPFMSFITFSDVSKTSIVFVAFNPEFLDCFHRFLGLLYQKPGVRDVRTVLLERVEPREERFDPYGNVRRVVPDSLLRSVKKDNRRIYFWDRPVIHCL